MKAFLVPLIQKGKLDKQRINVLIDGKKIGEWSVKNPEGSEEEIKITGNYLKGSPLKLTFELPDAKSPASIGLNEDPRILGVQFKSIMLYSPVYQPGTEILFGTKGNGEAYQGKGWSNPEDGYTWTDGKEAELLLNIPEIKSDLTMKVSLMPLVSPGKLEKQRVKIVINNKEMAIWTISDPSPSEKEIKIPKSEIKGSTLKITFQLPDAVSPVSIGMNEDPRVLGIQVRAITLK